MPKSKAEIHAEFTDEVLGLQYSPDDVDEVYGLVQKLSDDDSLSEARLSASKDICGGLAPGVYIHILPKLGSIPEAIKTGAAEYFRNLGQRIGIEFVDPLSSPEFESYLAKIMLGNRFLYITVEAAGISDEPIIDDVVVEAQTNP